MDMMTKEVWRQCIRQKMGPPSPFNNSNLF
jgi:hypothetical protein